MATWTGGQQGVTEGLNEFAMGGGEDGEDPFDNYPCYDCGSTIFLNHTKLCELAEENAIRDLPSKPGSQHWTGEIPKGLHTIPGLQEGVTEGLENNGISFQVQKGKNKFATTLSVGSNPVGVYQYDANTGRSVAEVYPEFKGKGLGKLLVLHAIYTAAMLGLDFQEDESRTSEYDNVLDSLSSSGYIVDDEEYWYVTGEGEQFLKQSLKQGMI